jgi:hypothetical protein
MKGKANEYREGSEREKRIQMNKSSKKGGGKGEP